MSGPGSAAHAGEDRRPGLGGTGESAGRWVLARARELAAGLSALFERDVEVVKRLNDAQRRLRDANERLWSGLSSDAFGLVYDGVAPAGCSQIAALMGDPGSAGGPDSEAAVLCALQEVHWQVHRGFCEFQSASEERRQLAVEVGELSQQLTEVLCALGWSAEEARNASVHELSRAGNEPPSGGCDTSRELSRSVDPRWSKGSR